MISLGSGQCPRGRAHIGYHRVEQINRCRLGCCGAIGLFADWQQAKNGDQAKASNAKGHGDLDERKTGCRSPLHPHRLKMLTGPEIPAI
jgi:hypothetical protein